MLKISETVCGTELASCQEQSNRSPALEPVRSSIIRARLRLSHVPTALPLYLDRRGQSCCVWAVLHDVRVADTQDSCIEVRSISFVAIACVLCTRR